MRGLGFEGGPRYELAGEHRHYFVCEPYGRVFDIPKQTLSPGTNLVAEIDRIQAYGRRKHGCETCAENPRKGR